MGYVPPSTPVNLVTFPANSLVMEKPVSKKRRGIFHVEYRFTARPVVNCRGCGATHAAAQCPYCRRLA